MEEKWCPQDAMKAYLQTIDLLNNKDDKARVIHEPKSMELVSAMAAGKGAKLMVEITTQGITPLTIALGVAAKQTGGQLICIIASSSSSSSDEYSNKDQYDCDYVKIADADLGDVVKLVHATEGRPNCEMMMQLKNIDFIVIDGKIDDNYLKVMFSKMDANIINPIGSTVIVHNLQHRKVASVSFAQVAKRKGIESVTLPIGEGIELTRIFQSPSFRRRKRFHITFHD